MEMLRDCDFNNLIEHRENRKGPMLYIKPFDDVVGGMPKRLTILGGFSGCFKTTLALNIVYNNAEFLGYNCCLLSLEMEKAEIFLRLLIRHAMHAKFALHNCIVTLKKVNDKGALTTAERDFLLKVVAPDLKSGNRGEIVIATSEEIMNASGDITSFIANVEKELSCRPLKWGHELDLLAIDYIQLLAKFSRKQFAGISDPFQIVGYLIRALKYITHGYDNGRGISIIALSQLNRSSYTDVRKRLRNPKIDKNEKYKDLFDLTSFSESSEIVNAADHVVAIYADDALKKENTAIIQLLKNRFGETIEAGEKILALPEIAYVGDFKDDEVDYDPTEDIRNFLDGLISGSI